MTALRVVLLVGAFLSPFFFPYPATLVLSLAAALFFPPAALLVGVLVDLLYLSPPALPFGILWGAVATILAFFIRRFMKARVMSFE